MTIYSIAYRTDLNLLKDTREKTAQIIDYFHDQVKLGMKQAPNNSRTYRKKFVKTTLSWPNRKLIPGKSYAKQLGSNYFTSNATSVTSQV